MSMTDPIADLLTRIRNASRAGHKFVDVRYSKIKVNIIDVLKSEGFIKHFLVDTENNKVRIFLKYSKGVKPVINNLRRISSPGGRRYVQHSDIPRVLGGMGIAVLSTPKGVLSDNVARKEHVGGEVLCYVW